MTPLAVVADQPVIAVRLAIVGSVRFANPDAWPQARAKITAAILWLRPAVMISGGAPGIDTLARQIAAEHGYTVENGRMIEHLPAHPRWEPDGYKARNIRIAEDCTHLLALRCARSRTYGSGWTADETERRGRQVWRRTL